MPQTSSRVVFEFNIKYLLSVSPGPTVGPTSFIFYNNADTASDPTTAGWSQVVQSNPTINDTTVTFTYNNIMLTANGLLNIPQSVMESASVTDRTISVSCLSYEWDSNYQATNIFTLGGPFIYTNSNTIIAIRQIQ